MASGPDKPFLSLRSRFTLRGAGSPASPNGWEPGNRCSSVTAEASTTRWQSLSLAPRRYRWDVCLGCLEGAAIAAAAC